MKEFNQNEAKRDSRWYGVRAWHTFQKDKELTGLTCSLVLRCSDCIRYHLVRCNEEHLTNEELGEALTIALIVGESITIPHLRRAFRFWDGLKKG